MKCPNEKQKIIMLCVFDFQYGEQTFSGLHSLNNKRLDSAKNDTPTKAYRTTCCTLIP